MSLCILLASGELLIDSILHTELSDPFLMKPLRAAIQSAKRTSLRTLLVESLEKRELFSVDWRNPVDSLDVNSDSSISPLDVLVVINEINQNGMRSLPTVRGPSLPYLDVTGDNRVDPLDVLVLVNHLNSNGAADRVLKDDSGFETEQSIVITLGQITGARVYQLEVDAAFGNENDNLLVGDLFSVYLVDPRDPARTLLDRGINGTSLFSMSNRGVETASGLSRWSNGLLELDLSSIEGADTGLLKIQLINGSPSTNSRIRVSPISNTIDEGRSGSANLPIAPAVSTFPNQIDISGYRQTTAIKASTANLRFDSQQKTLTTEVTLRNTGTAVGRNVALAFPRLPAGVTIKNASGVSSQSGPFLHLRDAVRRGGLESNLDTDSIELTFLNPLGLLFDSSPVIFVGEDNVAPVLPPIGPFNVLPGDTLQIDLRATDPNGDLVTYSIETAVPLPTYELFANGGLAFKPSPTEVGVYQFSVVASDGALRTSREVTLNVNSDPITSTRLSGTILDADGTPLSGLRVEVGAVSGLTRNDGRFELDLGSGSVPSETIRIRGELFQGTATYPFIAEKLPFMLGHSLYAGFNNRITRPIYLPKLDMVNSKQINPATTTVVTTAALAGTALTVGAGTLQNQQGTPFTGRLSITEVPTNRTPASIPDGLFPDIVVTIQPGEMTFSVPTPLSLPNRAGQPPGTLLDLWSINPTTGEFEVVGKGRVSADGSVTETVSGGVRNSSWHFFFPPLSNGPDNAANPDPGCPKQQFCAAASSGVILQTGGLVESHNLVPYQSLGQTRGVTLTYESERADPRPIFHVGYDSLNNSFANLRMAGNITFSGIDVLSNSTLSRLIAPGLAQNESPYTRGDNVWNVPQGQSSADGAMQADLSNSTTGIYSYVARTKLVAGNRVVDSSTYVQPYVHVNSIDSVFGRGWGISGLKEAFVSIATLGSGGGGSVSVFYEDEVLIVDGNGSEIRFTGGRFGEDTFQSPSGDFSTLRIDRIAGTLIHQSSNGDVYTYRRVTNASGMPARHYRLESMSDRNGNTTQYKYENPFGITSIVDPVGLETKFEYSNGNVTRIIDPVGRITSLSFNGKDLASITDPDTSRRQWSYDSLGHMIGETTKRGFKQVEQFDEFGRASGIVREDGSTSQYRPLAIRGLYPTERTTNLINPPDAAERQSAKTHYTDANGSLIQIEIDTRGQSISQRDPLGIKNITLRDDNNNVTSSFDSRNNETTYKYDSKGNVIEIADSISVESTLDNPTITWSGSVSDQWSDPANWSSNRLPSLLDDVLIPINPNGRPIIIDKLTVSVRRLYTYQSIRLSDSRLALSGESRFFDGIVSDRSELSSIGNAADTTIFSSLIGSVSTFRASASGRLRLPSVRTLDEFNTITFEATGNGSVVSLPVYSSGTLGSGRLRFSARDNGVINLPAVETLSAQGELELKSDGVIRLPKLSSVTGGTVTLDGSVGLDAPLLTSVTNSGISVNGANLFPLSQLTSINATSITASGGAKLSFPLVSTFELTRTGFVVTAFTATGTGSELSFPNLVSTTSPSQTTNSRVAFNATAGATIALAKLTDFVNTSFSTNGTGSEIDIPMVAIANGANFSLEGNSKIAAPLLTSVINGRISVNGVNQFPTSQLTSVNATAVTASGGAKLSFPLVTTFELTRSAFLSTAFTATGTGSELSFPNLVSTTSPSQTTNSRVAFNATAGATIALAKLTDFVNTSFSTNGTGSEIDIPMVAIANGANFSLEGNSKIDAPLLTSVINSTISMNGLNQFPTSQLTSVNATAVTASGGAKLSFPLVTTFELTRSAFLSTAFTATGTGSELSFPNLVSTASPSQTTNSRVAFNATAGATIALAKLTDFVNTSFATNGAGSEIKIPTVASANGSNFSLDGNSKIDAPLLTSVINSTISMNGLNQFPLSQFTSINATSITASGGAKLSLPLITTYELSTAQFSTSAFTATGTGSELSFPNLISTTSPSQNTSSRLVFNAIAGAMVLLPKLTNFVNTSFATNGASSEIKIPTVASANGSNFSLDGNSKIDAPLLTSVINSTISMNGLNQFPLSQFTSINATSITASGGAKLSLPLITTYELSTAQFSTSAFTATGTGSELSFPNLTSTTSPSQNTSSRLVFNAIAGAMVLLPKLTNFVNTSFATNGASSEIKIPTVASANGSNFSLDGNSKIDAPLLTSVINSTISMNGLNQFPLSQFTSINATSITASGGAKLSLPLITTYELSTAQFSTSAFTATGTGSELSFPNLTSTTSPSQNTSSRLVFNAIAGAMVLLPKLTNFVNTSFATNGASSEIKIPTVTSANGSNFSLDGNSKIDAPLLTSVINSTISMNGLNQFPLSQLTSINATSITASGGAKLSLPLITTYELSTAQFSTSAFTATGTGSELSFPNLISTTSPSQNTSSRLVFNATAGATIIAQNLSSAANTTLRADGVGSVIDAKRIAGLENVTVIETNGGIVLRGGEGESSVSQFFIGPLQFMRTTEMGPIQTVSSTPLVLSQQPEGENLTSTEDSPPQRFRYDPLFSQMVYSSDGRGNQTHYKIDPQNGNVLSMSRSIGVQPDDTTLIERQLGTNFKGFQAADLNNDGRDDYVYVVDGGLFYSLSIGKNFAPSVKFPSGSGVGNFAVVDDNGDGKPEIYAASAGQQKLFKWASIGSSGFIAPSEINVSGFPQRVSASDLDKDGDLDIVVSTDFGGGTNPVSNANVLIYANNGAGALTFEPSPTFSIGANRMIGLAITDLDLDGNVDIAVHYEATSIGSTSIELFWGGGTTNFARGSNPNSLSVGRSTPIQLRDVNNDGRDDLLGERFYIAAQSGRQIQQLGTTDKPASYHVSNSVTLRDIVFADINNDGFKDRIRAFDGPRSSPTSTATPGKIEIEFGKAGGQWSRAFHFEADISPHDLNVADFNGDGTLDLSFVSGTTNELEVRYDLFDQLFGIVGDANDEITRFTYTQQGLVDTMTDPLGRITDYDYDQFGRLVSTTMSKGTSDQIVSRLEYDASTSGGKAGLPTTLIDAKGNRTQIVYDNMNRVLRTIEADPDAAGPLVSPVTQMEYDAEGNLTKMIDAEGNATIYEYDSRNRQTVTTAPDPDGAGPQLPSRTEIKFDFNGNAVAVIDPLGNTTRNEYDLRNRVVKTVDARGGVTKYEYDRDDNLASLTDPVGNITKFRYDSRNRMTSEIDPLGKTIQYIYDGNDNLVEKIDRLERRTTYAYDELNRIVRETWVGGGNEILYTYDANSNLLSVKDSFSSLTYIYDQLDRVTSVDNLGTPGAPRAILDYTYDANGNVTSVVDTVNGQSGANTGYIYDALDRLTRLTQSGNGISEKRVDFSYNQIGQYVQLKRFSDLAGTQSVVATSYDHDGANRLTAIDHLNPSGVPLSFFHYSYDVGNRITSIAEIAGTIDYSYDRTDQLTGANYSDAARIDETYQYDLNGNRLATNSAPTGYTTGPANRLQSDGTYRYEYDAEGNMTKRVDIASGATREFTWDHRNRLIAVTDKTSAGSVAMRAEYAYDAVDRRIAKRVTYAGQATSEIHFVYDREDVMLDASRTGATGAFSFRRYLHADGIDDVLAQQDLGQPANWLLPDHIGSVQLVVSIGEVVLEELDYFSFGKVVSIAESTRFQFSGREFDGETGLVYLRNRYMNVSNGIFINMDKIDSRDGDVNRYRYALNSPTVYTDKFGLDCELTPQRLTPQRLTPQRLTPQRLTPQRLTPQRLTPQRLTPQRLTPQRLTPQRLTPQQLTPQRLTPQRLTPQRLTPSRLS